MKNLMILASLVLFLGGCATSKTTSATQAQQQETQQLLATGTFEFVADWAFPLSSNALNQITNTGLLGPGNTSGRVNLIGNPNYIRFQKDSLSGYLPFYGERQVSSFNPTDIAIVFEGIPAKYTQTYNEEKRRTEIQFRTKDGTESFQCNIIIYDNLKATVSVNSSQRNPIRYEGVIAALSTQEEK